MKLFATRFLILTIIVFAGGSSAYANSHLWRINEIFSNVDGSVQFIELAEFTGADAEFQLEGKTFLTNSKAYTFPNDLPGETAFKTFLMATQGFAALPGAPTPDYIIPDAFFDPKGDSLVYFVYDRFDFGAGIVPTDGVQSVNRFTLQPGVNSPKNFAGETASVVAPEFTACVLNVEVSYAAPTLQMDFDIGTSENSTWNVWLSLGNDTTKLWSVPLTALSVVSFPVQLPIPDVATMGVFTTLTTAADGIVCWDFETVDTSP